MDNDVHCNIYLDKQLLNLNDDIIRLDDQDRELFEKMAFTLADLREEIKKQSKTINGLKALIIFSAVYLILRKKEEKKKDEKES